jgi:restriction system protein
VTSFLLYFSVKGHPGEPAEVCGMARRNESILDLLAEAPWWVIFVVSGVAFLVLRYVVPAAYGEDFMGRFLARNTYALAPWVSLFLLVPAPFSIYNSWRKKKLLDSQKDLHSIRSLGWREFEELVGEAYRREGYTVRENTGAGPDGGIDLVLNKDGNAYLVQCKHWRSWKIGVKVVREMYGLLAAEHAHGVILITSGMFTQEARNFAAGKPIDLVEGRQLADLVASVQKSPALTSSNPPPIEDSTAKFCPKCGAEMVLKTARQGKYAGQQFWSCAKYPACKGLLPFKDGNA